MQLADQLGHWPAVFETLATICVQVFSRQCDVVWLASFAGSKFSFAKDALEARKLPLDVRPLQCGIIQGSS